METTSLLRLTLAVKILGDPLFFGPVLIISLSKLGHMTAMEVFLSEAMAAVLIILLDVPSGILADKIGRKKCVVLGRVFTLLYVTLSAIMENPFHAYLANAFWALGASLRGGAENALIYDELARRKETDEYRPFLERAVSLRALIGVVTTLSAGFIAEYDMRLPLLLSVPLVLIGTSLSLLLPKDTGVSKTKHSFGSYIEHGKEAITELRAAPGLLSLFLFLAVFGLTNKLHFFTFNAYLLLVGVPYREVGLIFAGIDIFAFIAGRVAGRLHKKLERLGIGVCFGVQGVIMITQALCQYSVSGYLTALVGVSRGYLGAVVDPVINSKIRGEKRATILSFQTTLSSLSQLVGFTITSVIASNTITLLLTLGTLALTLSFLTRKV